MIVATGADGAVTRVPAATVIAATGVVPATHWLPGWLPRDNAGHIVTDEAGHVIAGVYAVGDAAVRRDRHWGWVRGGHWTSAMSQPGAVAAAILGAAAPPAHAPYVFSTLMGHELGLLGDPRLATDTAPPAGRADGGSTRPRDDDDVDSPGQARAGAAPAESSSAAPPDAAARIIENAEVPGWTAQWVREADGATTAVLAVDQPRSIVSARKALRDGPSATWQPPVRTPR